MSYVATAIIGDIIKSHWEVFFVNTPIFDVKKRDQSKVAFVKNNDTLKSVIPIPWSKDVLSGKSVVVLNVKK